MYASSQNPAPLSFTVLVVDDEYSLRISLAMILEKAGFKVQSTANLAQARTILSNENFDLIFLDMKLPDGMGSDLLPAIHQKNPTPRVIIFSATPPNTLTFDPVDMGVRVYLEKPCDPEDIILAARKVMEV